MQQIIYLYLIYVANSMIELNRASALHVGLIRGVAIQQADALGSGCVYISSCGGPPVASTGHGSRAPLLLESGVFESSILCSCLNEQAGAVLYGSAEVGFWTFNTVLRPLLPLIAPLLEWRLGNARCMILSLGASPSYRLNSGTHRSGDSNGVGVVPCTALDSIAGWEKGIESLY